MKRTDFAAAGQTRRETVNFRVLVTPEEREAVIALAKRCKLSVSAYLRNLALGYSPVSALDMRQVERLLDVCVDQNRLGNLLKMFLTEREKYNETQLMSAARLLEKLEESQARLMIVVDQVLKNAARE